MHLRDVSAEMGQTFHALSFMDFNSLRALRVVVWN